MINSAGMKPDGRFKTPQHGPDVGAAQQDSQMSHYVPKF